MNVLILGAGHRQIRWLPMVDGALQQTDDWGDDKVVTLDNNPDVKPDYVYDLNYPISPYFMLSQFDEVHAYEVLEHLGSQGDAEEFFRIFSDVWDILKPNGHFYGSVPKWDSMWALGDPSHRRVIPEGSFVFLDQSEYARQCDGPERTPMSDFRHIYRADFETVGLYRHANSLFFDLKAIKPSRHP